MGKFPRDILCYIGRRLSNEADGENNSFNVVSDLVEDMNKGSLGKTKNFVRLTRNLTIPVFHIYFSEKFLSRSF